LLRWRRSIAMKQTRGKAHIYAIYICKKIIKDAQRLTVLTLQPAKNIPI